LALIFGVTIERGMADLRKPKSNFGTGKKKRPEGRCVN
jgi:hypothetical protein